ncbi:hypothetical protein BHM03_00020996, partial [Ensete ventricosum]
MANTALVFARPVASLVPFGLPWGQYKEGEKDSQSGTQKRRLDTCCGKIKHLADVTPGGAFSRPSTRVMHAKRWRLEHRPCAESGTRSAGLGGPAERAGPTGNEGDAGIDRGGEEGERKGARAAGRDKAMRSIPCSLSDLDSIRNSEEEVMVALDHLPRDATDMIDILKAEQAPLHLWLIIAVGSPSSLPVENESQLYVAKGELQTASESFRIALVEDPNCVPALLGQGDFEKALRYYMASVKETSKPQEFVLPYYEEEEEKKKKKRRRRSTSCRPSGDSAGGSPASRRRPRCPSAIVARNARGCFSPHTGRRNVSPRGRELEATLPRRCRP